MASIPPLAREAIEHARRRDFDKALATAKVALEQHEGDMGLHLFVALLHTRRMEFDEALPHLRAAVALAPNDPAPRLELVRVLIARGDVDEAEQLLSAISQPAREVQKLRGTILMQRGDAAGAAEAFNAVVAGDPQDFESWGNLGVALFSGGNASAAVEALGRSLQLRPDRANIRSKWAEAHIAAGSGEQALAEIRAAIGAQPRDPLLRVSAARLEDLLGNPDAALEDLHQALGLDPTNIAALTAVAELLERQNRIDGFSDAVDRLAAGAPDAEKLPLLRAQLAFRRGDLAEGLRLAESSPPTADPASRAQLIGTICDRLGDNDKAWDAYTLMNREDARAISGAGAKARDYRATLEEQASSLTPAWYEAWTDADQPVSSPAFLLGFPRSGTTLLDTFLMGHSDVCVSEENPLLPTVSLEAGQLDEIGSLSAERMSELREFYFATAERYVPGCADRLLVDKFPFALVAGPYIHRLFPDAPIILVERHPCDVVLSCYFTRFQPTGPGASFVDLEDTAKLYDGMMRFWNWSREVLPLRIHEVRYERLVIDTEAELRSTAAFLGIEWSDELVAHRDTASKRGFIKTPSYAQVSEPVYTRSVGRWQRYRRQLEPVLAILEPWVTRMGYEL